MSFLCVGDGSCRSGRDFRPGKSSCCKPVKHKGCSPLLSSPLLSLSSLSLSSRLITSHHRAQVSHRATSCVTGRFLLASHTQGWEESQQALVFRPDGSRRDRKTVRESCFVFLIDSHEILQSALRWNVLEHAGRSRPLSRCRVEHDLFVVAEALADVSDR
eukprot:767770-Hanusia_phi.AAC.4